ncbi:GspE/PulE family protein [Natranaerofaba carboxydovora]|uniref:GspE/PulE family protein n=1 Tax=Natranaerofaba carboxydovora TaxID=2742683 RepID=UPI001F1294EB|nr:ATPase, T2SS/T4P/T4SS family [Natranaerofaba carboxydovora]UMZ73516.1 Type II secretion system protein E [Natranaerofaba carboxydovora]
MAPKKSYFTDFLIEMGELTDEQLQDAVEKQKNSTEKKYLGQILVELGYVSEEAITRAVAAQAGVPFVSLEEYSIDEAATKLLNASQIKKYEALPIGFESEKLVIAMAQPRNIISIDDLRIITGYEIKPVIVTDSQLKESIRKYTDADLDFDDTDLAEEVEEMTSNEEVITAEGETGDDRPAVKLVNLIFARAVRAGASDIHLEPQEKGFRVRFRIDGVLHEVMQPPRRMHPSVISRVKVMSNMDIAEKRIPQDGRITLKVENRTIDVRVASLPTAFGEKITLRILDRSVGVFTLEELGIPAKDLDKLYKVLRQPYGFVLATGPTGSGKSTTLYAILSHLNNVNKHIVTMEDPIERRMGGINQVQVNEQAGLTFASGLRSLLRNDPDIALVGEIRDIETAKISVEASLTGHLVLSTLHTNEAAGAISRMNDMGIEPYLTASSLVCVVGQRLVRTLCNNCKVPYEYQTEELLKRVPNFPINEDEESIQLYRHEGCESCGDTGYKGRAGVYEVLIASDEIARLTVDKASTKEISNKAKSEGMTPMIQHGFTKVREGVTTLEEVLRVIV